MTKIDIVSGFLGAGKTTLIKKLLKEAFSNEKVVLIENEFGEIGIDGGFLKEAGVEITEMNSGCICCSLVGDFATALKDVLEKYSPDRVIIEPSGVGKLSDVIKAVANIELNDVKLNSFVAVVDVTKSKMYMKNFGEFFNNQIESANTIILSRSQNMSQDKLEKSIELIKEHNSNAAIITTPWDDITGIKILEAMEKGNSLAEELMNEETCPVCGHHHDHHEHEGQEHCCGHDHEDHEHEGHEHCCGHDHEDHEHEGHEHCCGHDHEDHEHEGHEHCCGHDHGDHDHEGHEHCCGHDHHHADDVFTSWGVETINKYTDEEIENILKVLSQSEECGIILRAKGMVPNVNGQWIYFDLVPGEYELRQGDPDYTGRLCVIGTNLVTSKIAELFHVNK